MEIAFHPKTSEAHQIHYNQFSVGNSSEGYPLTIGEFSGGNDTDWFVSHQLDGKKFSKSDNNNDVASVDCAAHWKIGCWYNNCTDININTKPPHIGNHHVVYSEMIIRSKHTNDIMQLFNVTDGTIYTYLNGVSYLARYMHHIIITTVFLGMYHHDFVFDKT